MAGAATISALLTCNGNGDLDVNMRDADGNLLASATASAESESLDWAASGVGQYTLRVIAVAGSGKYELRLRHP